MNKARCFLLLAVLIVTALSLSLLYHKYQTNKALEIYSYEQVLAHAKKPKNLPLINELYRLGNQVRSFKDLKSREVSDEEKRSAHILLSKICKDSCLPIRCRIDPGLGHACRLNCPVRKVKFCVTSLKPLTSITPVSK